jgi:hypothetical protein
LILRFRHSKDQIPVVYLKVPQKLRLSSFKTESQDFFLFVGARFVLHSSEVPSLQPRVPFQDARIECICI